MVHRLVAEGAEATALRHRTRRRWSSAARTRAGDLLRPADPREAVRDVAAVCHLAADTTVRQTSERATEPPQRQAITGGTGPLLAAMETGTEPRGTSLMPLNPASSAVYGRGAATSLRTTDATGPRSPCAAAEPTASPVRLPRTAAEKFEVFYHAHNRS
ncbi:NAD-dependent epimerase/dehydratase family protein [Streptomyces sp. MT29]|nr:NAD-dependent epimerase/dehydratase family protein [Streptomyces sp. MT29]